MRMWNVDPKLMCRFHLLGEHAEMHMFAAAIKAGKRIDGFVDKGLVDTSLVNERHDELVGEMIDRGFKHNTPLEEVACEARGKVVSFISIRELSKRCIRCRRLMESKWKK